jgi:hypothetical protein
MVSVVLWVSCAVSAIDVALVSFVLFRRGSRHRYYKKKDAALRRLSMSASLFMSGQMGAEAAHLEFCAERGPAERDALQQLLIGGITLQNRVEVTDLLVRLGYVQSWTEQVFGKRRSRELLDFLTKGKPLPQFRPSLRHRLPRISSLRLFAVSRAIGIIYLGKLSPRFASVFTAEALHDPASIVQQMNVSAMGHNRDGQTPVTLVLQLRAAVEGKIDLPVRWVKTALVRYTKSDLVHVAPYLADPNPHFRFLLVDIIREICQRELHAEFTEAPPKEIHDWFLQEAVRDPSADVRARSAQVIRYFYEPAAVKALSVLLEDESEFVRLHAVRGCRDKYYSELLDQVLTKVCDQRWRVREAAVATISSFGKQGLQLLSEYFVKSTDRYATEQFGDELQRSGVIAKVVLNLKGETHESALSRATCARLVKIGKTSFLTDWFGTEQDEDIRAALANILIAAPTPTFVSLLETAARNDSDPLQGRARQLLEQLESTEAVTAGGQSA